MSEEPQFDRRGEEEDSRPQSFVAGLRERLEWAARMSLLVFILAAAAFLSAITAMRIAIHGREVNMPNLVGKNVSEAGQVLRSRGLGLRVADHVYSDVPINVVVRQTPPPGMQRAPPTQTSAASIWSACAVRTSPRLSWSRLRD